jgi:UDP-N-acetylmuramate dehydrogenase
MEHGKRVTGAYQRLEKCLKEKVWKDWPLAKETTLKVGGNAAIFALVDSIGNLQVALETASEFSLPFLVIGRGSNLLVSDNGFKGLVVKLTGDFKQISFNRNIVEVRSAVSLPYLAREAAKRGLSGFEFLEGIPGSLGGGIATNAGAFGKNLLDLVEWVTALNLQNGLKLVKRSEIEVSYRSSEISKNGVIIEGCFRLTEAEPKDVRKLMRKYMVRRKKTQPVSSLSAGCVFKNPPNLFAGELIEKTGLKGFSIGDAQISELHANFIINKGQAKASDVYNLMQVVRRKVYEIHGVVLEPEIELIGEFDKAGEENWESLEV